jgi:hypothetical protein
MVPATVGKYCRDDVDKAIEDEDILNRTKLALVCFQCGGILFGTICFKHHFAECKRLHPASSFQPISFVNQNPNFLCKWLDCRRCRIQTTVAKSPAGSFLSLRLKVICWARMTLLMVFKQCAMANARQACKKSLMQFPVNPEALSMIFFEFLS